MGPGWPAISGCLCLQAQRHWLCWAPWRRWADEYARRDGCQLYDLYLYAYMYIVARRNGAQNLVYTQPKHGSIKMMEGTIPEVPET